MTTHSAITKSVVLLCVGLIGLGIFLVTSGIISLMLEPIVIYTTAYDPSVTVQKIRALTNAIHVRLASTLDAVGQSAPYCFDKRLTMYSKQHLISMETRTINRDSMIEYYGITKGITKEFVIDGNATTIYPELNSSRYRDILVDTTFISLGVAANEDESKWHFTLWDSKCKQTILYNDEVRRWLDNLTK